MDSDEIHTFVEIFHDIPGFPMYQVSNAGNVRNVRFNNRPMARSVNQKGEPNVGLVDDDGRQHRYSIRGLVARAFVPGKDGVFDTPIAKDGDRFNCHAANIEWRPRWFAIKYMQQFEQEEQWWYAGPVIDHSTGEVYDTIIHAAVDTGSLVRDIRLSLYNGSPVFPRGGRFAFL